VEYYSMKTKRSQTINFN